MDHSNNSTDQQPIDKGSKYTRNGIEVIIHDVIDGIVYGAKRKVGTEWSNGQLWKMPYQDLQAGLRNV